MIAPAELTYRQLFRQSYTREKLAKRKNGGRASVPIYETCLNRFAQFFADRDPWISEGTDAAVRGTMLMLRDQGRSPATCNQTRRCLLSLIRFAMARKKLRRRQIEVEPFEEPGTCPRAWKSREFFAILHAAAEVEGVIRAMDADGRELGEMPARLFWTALLLLIYDSGLRISAAMALRWDNVDWETSAVWVAAATQKQNAEQYLDLSPQTMAALRAIAEPARQKLFPWPYDRQPWNRVQNWPALNRGFRAIIAAAGLPVPRGQAKLFHRIRRTTASYCKAAGGNPTERLGHSSAAVTQRYLDPSICGQARISALLPRPGQDLPPERRPRADPPAGFSLTAAASTPPTESPVPAATGRIAEAARPGILWPALPLADLITQADTLDDWRPPIGGRQKLLFE